MIPPNLQLLPVVRKLWDLVEAMYGKSIDWLDLEGSVSDIKMRSRIDTEGTPIIAYNPKSVINDQSVSHELLHLWRFGCSVPVINSGPHRNLEEQLANIQNNFEHLWIYSIQESPPFNFTPWNKPHPQSQVVDWIDMKKERPSLDMSWGISCDVKLSRPLELQVYLKEVTKGNPIEVEKAKAILALWTFDNIDSATGAADTLLKVIGITGIVGETVIRWQVLSDKGRTEIRSTDLTFPDRSLSKRLAAELSGS